MFSTQSLTKSFGGRPALNALTLDIRKGDRIALIGSNGAGKTTLFRCLLGHYNYQGSVTFDGKPVGRRDAAALSRIAFVPQLPPPLRMPVSELLAFSAIGAGGDRQEMTTIAEKLGMDLDEVRTKPFYRLSGGQKQKILVTVALSRNADLMIFDEPAANLDPAARAVFIDLLAERKDSSMLIASHRLEEVASLVNRVIELDQGQVVLDDEVVDRLRAEEFRQCAIGIRQPHPAFAAALAAWGFTASQNGLSFTGSVPAAETFRFMGLTARYGSLIERLSLDDGEGQNKRHVH